MDPTCPQAAGMSSPPCQAWDSLPQSTQSPIAVAERMLAALSTPMREDQVVVGRTRWGLWVAACTWSTMGCSHLGQVRTFNANFLDNLSFPARCLPVEWHCTNSGRRWMPDKYSDGEQAAEQEGGGEVGEGERTVEG